MSGYVLSTGFIAILANPVNEEDWEDISDSLGEAGLQLNYDGNLVFSETTKPARGIVFNAQNNHEQAENEFIASLKKIGLEIIESSQMPYTSIWYDGAESDMTALTIEKYKHNLAITKNIKPELS